MRKKTSHEQPRSDRTAVTMGSLPNLHELSKDKLGSPAYKPAPIGGLGPARLPPQPPPLAHSHKRARSSGHHHSTLCDNDAMLEVPNRLLRLRETSLI